MSRLSLPIKRTIELKDEWGKHYRYAQTLSVNVDPRMYGISTTPMDYAVTLKAQLGETLWWTTRMTFEAAKKIAESWFEEVNREAGEIDVRYIVRYFVFNGETYWEVRDGDKPLNSFHTQAEAFRFAGRLNEAEKHARTL